MSVYKCLSGKGRWGEEGRGGNATKKKRDEQSKKEAETRGCCVPWESRVSSMAGTGGFTGRNRCLLSAPVGLPRNNRPVTLRKCGETACVCVCLYVFVRLLFSVLCTHAPCLRIVNSREAATSEWIELVRQEPLAANMSN